MARKWTNTYCKMTQPRHRTREQMKKHASRLAGKWSASSSGKPCGRLRITSGQGRHPAEQASRDKWKASENDPAKKPARKSLCGKWKQRKRNESTHTSENDPAKREQTIIWETNERKSKGTFVRRPRHTAEQSSWNQTWQSHRSKASSTAIGPFFLRCKNPSQLKLFLIKTWVSIDARFKPWSSLKVFRQPRSWILPQSSAWDFSPGERASDQMTTICFTRKNHFDQKKVKCEGSKKEN